MNGDLDIGLLRTFVAVADTRGFTKAARLLYRTQSAVSMQIKRLEDCTGQRLLHRKKGGGISLTPEGELLWNYARRILLLNEEARAHLKAPASVSTVRIVVPESFMSDALPLILKRFSENRRGVQVEVHTGFGSNLRDTVDQGDFDLAVVRAFPTDSPDAPRWRAPLVWASPRSKWPDPIPLVLFPEPCQYREHALTALAAAGRTYRVVYTAGNVAALVAAASAGLGIAVLAAHTKPPHLRTLGPAQGFPKIEPANFLLYASHARTYGIEIGALKRCVDEVLRQRNTASPAIVESDRTTVIRRASRIRVSQ